MTFKQSILCAAVLSAMAVTAAHAQTGGGAGRTGGSSSGAASAPKGELSTPNQDKGGTMAAPSNTSREAVKADAKAARQSGTIVEGQKSTPTQGTKPMPATTSNSRAGVKAEAAAANTSPVDKAVGEKSQKDQDKGVTKP